MKKICLSFLFVIFLSACSDKMPEDGYQLIDVSNVSNNHKEL